MSSGENKTAVVDVTRDCRERQEESFADAEARANVYISEVLGPMERGSILINRLCGSVGWGVGGVGWG